ncbi:response regulator transcription factor [Sphingomonas sp. JC676]|uniref:response regulator transcription factor n=1 Tax=Sphingomonas sp. JC676 TaxID=2768065 RepID=UPI001657F73E|nr:response regulator transcription factor [Sphingomonas sp. JC676]MBC9033407.1 response regulator transcription factor [Sphingomonas sp. JC676]
MQLLVVEDDAMAAKQLVADLAELGHGTMVAQDGRAALSLATDSKFDAVLLDVMLPYVDGVGVAKLLRERGIDVPIIMLTALGDLDQRLDGLDAGADDYLVKPAAPAEIDARLRAIIRRAARTNESGVMRAGDIEVNEIKYRAMRAGRPLALQNLEFRILCELVRNANSVVTRQMLYQTIWNFDFEPATNVVDAHIRRIRLQINQPGERDPIKTIRGVGYMFTDKE